MPNQEKPPVIIRDIVLPVDYNTRYDLYFTDSRIGIVCMGSVDRFGYAAMKLRSIPSASGAVSPPLTYVDEDETKSVEDELAKMPFSDILKLSKKSSAYTHQEIEKVRLVWGKKPKFVIVSADCESKLAPDQEQFMQLFDLLTTFEPLTSKLEVAGNWKQLQQILRAVRCGECGVENDLDAVCCVNCGQKIQKKAPTEPSGMACKSCGTKNKKEAVFCKQCGANVSPILEDTDL
jgi:hypothetical protein